MDKLLILTIFGVQAILFLMSINTLNKKLNRLKDEIRANTVHIDGQAEKVITEIEERGQFEGKALGTLAQNIALCGYEVKEVREKLESSTTKIKEDIKKSTHIIVTTPVKTRI